jgi:cyclin D3
VGDWAFPLYNEWRTETSSSQKKMAIQLLDERQLEQQQEQNSSLLLDALYCEEERWEEEVEEEGEVVQGESEICSSKSSGIKKPSLFPLLLLEQDLFLADEELLSLFSKEEQQQANLNHGIVETESAISAARREAVEWMLKVNAHYGFSSLAAILSINYLDRFLASHHFHRDNKPWMMQLVAVACLSLAAKVEETQVPILLDLQVRSNTNQYMYRKGGIFFLISIDK